MNEDPEKLGLQFWPESEKLRRAVSAAEFDQCYTMPGLKCSAPLPDVMANVVENELKKTITRPSVPKNMDGVHLLITAGHLRSAVNLTADLLTEVNQGFGMAGRPSNNTEYSFQVWACRLQLLMALKLYTLLNDELLPFEELDAPDMFYQYYPSLYHEDMKGSLVLFSMRLVHAEALRFTSYPWAALERIDRLEQDVNKVLAEITNNNVYIHKVWNDRLFSVQKMRARTLFALKEYNASMILFDRLSKTAISSEEKAALNLMLMRMAMIIGDQKKLEFYLNEAASLSSDDQVLHRCLKCIFYGNYNEAYEMLQTHVKSGSAPELYNNAAVCLLYKGQVVEAAELLENMSADLNEPTAINYSTITELSASSSAQENLTVFAQKFGWLPDMFDPVTLKLVSS